MKKITLILTLIVVFTAGTINLAAAKPSNTNPGQSKKAQVADKAKKADPKRDTLSNPGQSKKVTTPQAIKVSVIKIGRLQLPVAALRDAGCTVTWNGVKDGVITISKDGLKVEVKVIEVGKKTTKILINGKDIISQNKGNGVINPLNLIKKLLGIVPAPKPTTTSAITIQHQ